MSDFKVGDKVMVIESISTIDGGYNFDGTLDEDEICTVDGTYITRDGRYVLFYHVPIWGGGNGICCCWG